MAIATRINYGGGNCGPGTGPCQGLDCPGTSGDCYPYCDPPPGLCPDGSQPIPSKRSGGFECPDPGPCVGTGCPPNNCSGPCCVNNECICNDCSWGNDGDWHIYWSCDDDHEIIVLNDDRSISDLESHNNHFDNSQTELGSTITIPSHFGFGTDAIIPFVSYPNDCYTYLGKKYGTTPSDVVTAGLTVVEGLWAGTSPRGQSFSHQLQECKDCGPVTPPPPIGGCMDPTACNYNPNATGSSKDCCYITGCTDPTALNYNAGACCDDGSCCFQSGCTNPLACNYNSKAPPCIDDGSCCFNEGCMDDGTVGNALRPSNWTGPATNYDPNACCPGTCIYTNVESPDYTYVIWCSFFKLNGNVIQDDTFYTELNAAITTNSFSYTDIATMFGGTQNTLPDFNGTQRIMVPGDTVRQYYPFSDNNNIISRTYVGVISSSTDLVTSSGLDIGSGVFIQSSGAQVMLGPGVYSGGGNSPTITAYNFLDSSACCDKITTPTCSGAVSGCTDPTAHNYNPLATIDDGSCEFCVTEQDLLTWQRENNEGQVFDITTFISGKGLTGTGVFCGCKDVAANNYWSWATFDPVTPNPPGSCTYISASISGCTDDGNSPAGTTFGNLTRPSIHPAGVPALNYNPSATSDDSSCLWCTWTSGSGCTTNGVCNSGGSGWFIDYNNSNINGNYPRFITIGLKPNGNGISEVKLSSNQVSNGVVTSLTKDTSFTSFGPYGVQNGWEQWSVTLSANVGFTAPNNAVSFLVYESDGAGGTSVCNPIIIGIGLG